MKLDDLYDIAEDDGIEISFIECPLSGSMSFMASGGNCYIGIDEGVSDNGTEKKMRIAHELGHCETGSFYNRYSKFDIISKHEYRADKWSIEKLMPTDEIQQAYEKGYTELWQMAEYFDLPQDFVEKAINYYRNCGY